MSPSPSFQESTVGAIGIDFPSSWVEKNTHGKQELFTLTPWLTWLVALHGNALDSLRLTWLVGDAGWIRK